MMQVRTGLVLPLPLLSDSHHLVCFCLLILFFFLFLFYSDRHPSQPSLALPTLHYVLSPHKSMRKSLM